MSGSLHLLSCQRLGHFNCFQRRGLQRPLISVYISQNPVDRIQGLALFFCHCLLWTLQAIGCNCTASNEIAKEAEFFSFGTNDLTQMTFKGVLNTQGSFS
ncbi:hypothetical protein L1987_29830 [Smallanthus sonchifolius]|uniref:Uncharacterized protein n=1 Tax=Smallanthus sonchifolius TaxID=185202 RepID=A0ACB9I3T5_9ASTR|nr:hypothetical protein L1987_29830 [Smallanthus sonchifolius]